MSKLVLTLASRLFELGIFVAAGIGLAVLILAIR
jgi:hypothetical protein